MIDRVRKPIFIWLIVSLGLFFLVLGAVLFTSTKSHTAVSRVGEAQVKAELFMQMQANPTTLRVGGELTYRLRVRNLGPSDATGVIITDTLPANVNFVSASSGCSRSDRTVTCEIGNLAKGRTVTLEIKVKVSELGRLHNTATVTANEPDPILGDAMKQQIAASESVPPGYSSELIDVKFREGTNVDPPEDALPPDLRNAVASIRRGFSLSEEQRRRTGADRLRLWFRIGLKPGVDPVDFIERLKRLNSVESAQFVPRPAPPPGGN
jgi:uncharacterized repeat protein (TIGR01451 family)